MLISLIFQILSAHMITSIKEYCIRWKIDVVFILANRENLPNLILPIFYCLMYIKYQWYCYNTRLLHLKETISFTTIERVVPIAHGGYITTNIHAECNSESDVLVFMAKLLFSSFVCIPHTKEDSGLAMQGHWHASMFQLNLLVLYWAFIYPKHISCQVFILYGR